MVLSRYRKLEIQLRVKTDSLYLTTPKHSGGEDKLAVQVQTPKHSGGADIIGSAGAVNPAVQSLQLGQRIQSSPHPSGKYWTRPGENSLRTWKTDTERKNTTRVKTIWQRTTETPARYRQCRRVPVTVLITSSGAWSLGNADKHNERVHPHRRTQNEHTDPWTVTGSNHTYLTTIYS